MCQHFDKIANMIQEWPFKNDNLNLLLTKASLLRQELFQYCCVDSAFKGSRNIMKMPKADSTQNWPFSDILVDLINEDVSLLGTVKEHTCIRYILFTNGVFYGLARVDKDREHTGKIYWVDAGCITFTLYSQFAVLCTTNRGSFLHFVLKKQSA